LLHRGRPKGRRFFPVTITLSQEQVDYLQRQPNASELIRKILDDLINAGKEVEAKLTMISLSKQLEELQIEKTKLKQERWHYVMDNKRRWKEEIIKVEGYPDTHAIKWKNAETPVPKDDEDGRIGASVLKGYDDAINALQQKIDNVKGQILEGE